MKKFLGLVSGKFSLGMLTGLFAAMLCVHGGFLGIKIPWLAPAPACPLDSYDDPVVAAVRSLPSLQVRHEDDGTRSTIMYKVLPPYPRLPAKRCVFGVLVQMGATKEEVIGWLPIVPQDYPLINPVPPTSGSFLEFLFGRESGGIVDYESDAFTNSMQFERSPGFSYKLVLAAMNNDVVLSVENIADKYEDGRLDIIYVYDIK